MSRTWIYERMNGDGALTSELPGGIHASTSLDHTPHEKPFVMYRSVANVPDLRGDDIDQTATETFLIFVHDQPGDYLAIDEILSRAYFLFSNVTDPSAGIIRSNWLETSEDFRDEDMGTIMKYLRVQVKYKVNHSQGGG